jgi:hypothetical protein
MSEQGSRRGRRDEAGSAGSTGTGVERGGMDEASGAPLTETEVETSKKPEDRDSNV